MMRVKRITTALLAMMMIFGTMGALTVQTAYAAGVQTSKMVVSPPSFKSGETITVTFDVEDTTAGIGKNPVTKDNATVDIVLANSNFEKAPNFNARVESHNPDGVLLDIARYTIRISGLKAKSIATVKVLEVQVTGKSPSAYNRTISATVPGHNGSTGGGGGGPADPEKPDGRYTVKQVYTSKRNSTNTADEPGVTRYDLDNLTTGSDASIYQSYYVTMTMRVAGDKIPAGILPENIITDDMGSFVYDKNWSEVYVDETSNVAGFFEVTFVKLRYSGNSKKLNFNIKKADITPGVDYLSNVTIDTITECVTRQEAAAASGGGGNNNNNNDDYKEVDEETPYIIVSKYGYGGGNVTAGDTFSLSLTFYNTSEVREISNMMITLTMPEDLMLTSSSNTFYVPTLHKLDSITKSVQVTAKPAAKAQSHNVGVSMKYQYVDERANARRSAETTENVAIPVIQVDRFELTSVDVPMETMLEEETSITVNYVNKGRSDVYNIALSIEGDIQNPGQNQNMGNLASGATGTADFFIKPNAAGVCSGLITITYEDTNMEKKTTSIPYNTNVKTMEEMNGGMGSGMFPGGGVMPGMGEGEVPGEEAPKSKLPIYIILGVVVAIPVLVIIKKRFDKKRREKEDADL